MAKQINRAFPGRPPGRPPLDEQPPQALANAAIVESIRRVPAIVCPVCQRADGHPPAVLRWVNGIAQCRCHLCDRRFDYTPPKVRAVDAPLVG